MPPEAMREKLWRGKHAVATAYAGTQQGAAAVVPAARALRRALPEARVLWLWPEDVDVPRALASCRDALLRYPTSDRSRAFVGDVVEALKVEAPHGLIVFTEPGWSAHAPAYLGYLAGIPDRIGIAAEFGGGVLSEAVATPLVPMPAEEWHLYLLNAAGVIATDGPGREAPGADGGRAVAGDRSVRCAR